MSLLILINSRYRPCCHHDLCYHCWLWSISTSYNILNYAVKSFMLKYAVMGLKIMILSPSSFCILQRRRSAWLMWILLIEILHNISCFHKVTYIILSFILWMSQWISFLLNLKLYSVISLSCIQNVINFLLFIVLNN